jgi:membrane protein
VAETPKDTKLRRQVKRVTHFLQTDLWELPAERGIRKSLIHSLRMGVLTFEGFMRSDLLLLAGALTFKVVFALVPLLALMLAIFKGFGGLDTWTEEFKQFLIRSTVPDIGNQFVEHLDSLVEGISPATLGAVGFLVLAYIAISLLHTVEKAMNRIWGIKKARTIWRKLMVYWTVLTAAPIVIMLSLMATAFVQHHTLYAWLNNNVPGFGAVMVILGPLVFTWLLFAAVYLIMPNTRVRLGAAIRGAILAGTAWELMKHLFVWYNANVVTMYSFYGSLGAIPVFLLWIYLSWIVLLFGVEIAFAAQHVRTYKREIGVERIRQEDKERLALLVAIEAVRAFEGGRAPPEVEAVAETLGAPVRAVNDVTFQLVSKGVLRETAGGDAGLLPGRDPAQLTAKDVLEALRSFGDPCGLPAGGRVDEVVERASREAGRALDDVTLKDLAR